MAELDGNENVLSVRRLSVLELSDADFDYDSVNSPGASSTSSEPVYIRQPGFDHHAHEFRDNLNHGSLGTGSRTKVVGTCVQLAQKKIEPETHTGTEIPPATLHSNFFSSPPHSPLALYSPIHSSCSYSSVLSVNSVISSTGTPSQLTHQKLPTCKTPPTPNECSEKSRTGNHTPPGYSTGKASCKKKKTLNPDPSKEGGESSKTSWKPRIKREPLPMKLRALPQSFWLQPNNTNNVPPSCSVLPPLFLGKDVSDINEEPPITPPADKEGKDSRPEREERHGERIIKVGNTDLLFRLFDSVEKDDKKRPQVVRRGRPRKIPSTLPMKSLRDEDPCLVSTATESILPLLPERTPGSSGSSTPLGIRQFQGQQILELVSIRDGNRTVSLPSLNVDHNYSQLLSELVLKL